MGFGENLKVEILYILNRGQSYTRRRHAYDDLIVSPLAEILIFEDGNSGFPL